jgi:hypothetical protein
VRQLTHLYAKLRNGVVVIVAGLPLLGAVNGASVVLQNVTASKEVKQLLQYAAVLVIAFNVTAPERAPNVTRRPDAVTVVPEDRTRRRGLSSPPIRKRALPSGRPPFESEKATVRTVTKVPGIGRLTPAELQAFAAAADEANVSLDGLAVVMSIESGFNPAAVNILCKRRNPNNQERCATGLIQFMPSTARGLGTTTTALRKMSFTQQLPYVIEYYKRGTRTGRRFERPSDAYMWTFMPAYIDKPDDFVISRRGQAVYDQNPGLDKNRDGTITVADVRSIAENHVRSARIEIPETAPVTPPEARGFDSPLGGVLALGGIIGVMLAVLNKAR